MICHIQRDLLFKIYLAIHSYTSHTAFCLNLRECRNCSNKRCKDDFNCVILKKRHVLHGPTNAYNEKVNIASCNTSYGQVISLYPYILLSIFPCILVSLYLRIQGRNQEFVQGGA